MHSLFFRLLLPTCSLKSFLRSPMLAGRLASWLSVRKSSTKPDMAPRDSGRELGEREGGGEGGRRRREGRVRVIHTSQR